MAPPAAAPLPVPLFATVVSAASRAARTGFGGRAMSRPMPISSRSISAFSASTMAKSAGASASGSTVQA